MQPASGDRIGPYEIIAPLRAGGMAALYLGRRAGPGGFTRPVAIKLIHSQYASDPSFVRMFLDEARLAARISHPGVVQVEALGEDGGVLYLAMEYVLGVSLAALLGKLVEGRRALAPELACAIAMRVADGLHALHEVTDESGRPLEAVHRDVSPQNVLLSRDGHVKLIDFGVAKARGRAEVTEGGALKGKVRYMSPEQAWGDAVDRRTDVYALGVVLWELLTQRRLFTADNDLAALEQVRRPLAPRPSSVVGRDLISAEVDHVVLTALAPRREERFETAQALRRALGNACPAAARIEAEDFGALVEELAGADLARERDLLLRAGSAEPRSSSVLDERQRTVVTRLTRPSRADIAGAPADTDAGDEPSLREASERPEASERMERPDASVPAQTSAREGSAAAERARSPTSSRTMAGPAVVLATLGIGALVTATWAGPAPTTSAPPSAPPLPVRCEARQRVELLDGEQRSLALDTRREGAWLELPGARNGAFAPAPQIVLEIAVPGQGARAIDLSTTNAGTDARFDTLIGVFRGPCVDALATRPADLVFDDSGREFRAHGALVAQGGDVLTVVVTGFGGDLSNRTDRGLVQLDVRARETNAPELRSAELVVAGDELLVRVTGADADGDVARVRVAGADGGPVHEVSFDRSIRGAREFSEHATLMLDEAQSAQLADVQRLTVTLTDSAAMTSQALEVPVIHAHAAGPGEPCDATRVCAAELECSTHGRCVPGVERETACSDPRGLTLTSEGAVLVGSAQGAIEPGRGRFAAQCLPDWTGGREDLYRLAIPPGRWDLTLSTDTEGTAGESRRNPDTIVYVRRSCLDRRSVSAPFGWCNDDIAPGEGLEANQRSRLRIEDVEAEELFVFVELWGSATPDGDGERYELEAVLTPVLAVGETCDPDEPRVRCAAGRCDAITHRCVAP